MKMNRPKTTLFMLESLDGKISSGASDNSDFDSDLVLLGLSDGLQQYYDYEQTTDLFSLNSGRVLAKIGINKKQDVDKTVVSFIVIDNSHLDLIGVENLCVKSKAIYIITSNPNHPSFNVKSENLEILFYEEELDFVKMFCDLKSKYGIESVTVQTGGSLNSILLRNGLIDYISVFIAPIIVGGSQTSTLVDGIDICSDKDLKTIQNLELLEVNKLQNSFLHLKYKVL